jgi:phosphate transport system substrate-binding protein
MTSINQALSDRFKTQFPGTQVDLVYSDSEAALQAVLEGKADLAAIGRPLTAEEQAQGLVAVPVARNRIAVFVGANNPFTESLTGEQFASIFRGEITDWSQVGGVDLPIRLIDRPDSSDTRRAFANYPVFQVAPFQPGASTVKVAEDNTNEVIQQLGNDGISYGITDQVSSNPAVRILPLYGTFPNDPRYPFSQPLSYVYKGANPSPAIQGFLGIATAPDSQAAVETARVAAATAAIAAAPAAAPSNPAPAASPAPASPDPASASPTASSPVASPGAASPGAASPGATAPGSADGGANASPGNLITAIEGDSFLSRWWWLLPALGGLGLLAWLLRDRSEAETLPAEVALREAIVPATVIPEASNPVLASTALPEVHDSRIVLTPRNCKSAHATWEVSEAHRTLLKQQGGQDLKLRLYDVTNIDAYYQTPHSTQEFDCSESAQDLHVPIPIDDRDYVAEIGYLTSAQRWLPLARSPHVRVPVCLPSAGDTSTLYDLPVYEAPPTAVDETSSKVEPAVDPSAVVLSNLLEDSSQTVSTSETVSGNVTAGKAIAGDAVAAARSRISSDRATAESRLLLVPRSAEEIYAYWEVSEERKQELRQKGGQRLVLRIYDITGVDLNDQPPKGLQQFECSETANDRHVSVPSYGDYIATLGYLTGEGRWLSVARSAPVRIRSSNASTPGQTPRDH